MDLLNENQLIWTAVVANCSMNRKRNLRGVNSYQNDIDFDVVGFLKAQMNVSEKVHWVDLCCGEGKAVIQASELFKEEQRQHQVEIEGVDLIDMFDPFVPSDYLQMKATSLNRWQPQKPYDLITCVHGLHYIGDKLSVIEKIVQALKPTGKFIGDIDFENVRDSQNKSLKREVTRQLKQLDIHYDTQHHRLICEGNRNLKFPYQYLGADDKAGKNYTGQEVVNSIYKV